MHVSLLGLSSFYSNIRQYKDLKGLKKQNLRDNMSTT